MNLTPREKAVKLVDTFRMFADGTDSEDDRFSPMINAKNAIQCALITIEEIVKELTSIDDGQTTIPYDYWKEVKKETELL
jgi:hypothetical protein